MASKLSYGEMRGALRKARVKITKLKQRTIPVYGSNPADWPAEDRERHTKYKRRASYYQTALGEAR